MDKLKTHFKNYSKYYYALLVIFMIAATIFMPVLINRAYRIPKGISYSDNFESQIGDKTYSGKARNIMWNCDTSLLYFGSVLTFIGTMFLGVVALYQNNKNNKFLKQQLKGGISIFEPVRKDNNGYIKKYQIKNDGLKNYVEFPFKNRGPQHAFIIHNHNDQIVCCDNTAKIKIFLDGHKLIDNKIFTFDFSLLIMNLYGQSYLQHFKFELKPQLSAHQGNWVSVEESTSFLETDKALTIK